jgi:hypothetical protein
MLSTVLVTWVGRRPASGTGRVRGRQREERLDRNRTREQDQQQREGERVEMMKEQTRIEKGQDSGTEERHERTRKKLRRAQGQTRSETQRVGRTLSWLEASIEMEEGKWQRKVQAARLDTALACTAARLHRKRAQGQCWTRGQSTHCSMNYRKRNELGDLEQRKEQGEWPHCLQP